MIRRTILGLVVAFISLLFVAPDKVDATHEWKICIDNYSNPDVRGSWVTSDTITVYLGGNGWVDVGRQVTTATTTSGCHALFYSSPNVGEVEWIEVWTDGTDMFVIDQLEVFDNAGALVTYFGVDNMRGYCLSEDPADGDGNPECWLEESRSVWRFDM